MGSYSKWPSAVFCLLLFPSRVILELFWKTAKDFLPTLLQLEPGFLSALNICYSLRAGSKLSYSRARELFIQKFKAINLDTNLNGLHSLRIGGASAASNNNVPDRVIKHGRWKSDKAKDVYCKEDIQHQLLVTLSIGI